MPKSKRAKVVNLTKVKKKTREWKSALLEKVRTLCDKHSSVYVIKYYNMRNDRFKELREDLRESSSFMLASTKKLQAALGREEENECRPQVHKLCPFLFGSTGLLFTNLQEEEVSRIFEDFFHEDYARAGAKCTRTVKLPEGPLVGPNGTPFTHTMEHTLRANGLPTKLNKGVIELRCEHTVCTEGKSLTTQQAALLRHFDIKLATFRLKLKAVVHGKDADSAQFKLIDEEESDDDVPQLEGEDGDVAMFDDGLPSSMMLPATVAQG